MKLNKIQREQLKQKLNGHCAYCGELLGNKWHADHYEPLRRNWWNGTSMHPEREAIKNYMPACVPCNLNKSSLALERWREQLAHYPDQLKRDTGQFRHALRFGLVQIVAKPVIFFFEKQGGAL